MAQVTWEEIIVLIHGFLCLFLFDDLVMYMMFALMIHRYKV